MMPVTTTLITGATSGIGKVTARQLAALGHSVFMLVRNTVKGEALREEIVKATGNRHVYVQYCDLADLDSIRLAAETLKNRLDSVQVLINNAGSAFLTRELSVDGYEMTFAVNHLGHFFLTRSILPLLQKGQARMINVSSEAHRSAMPNFADLNWQNTPYRPLQAYGMSKLYNIYFTKIFADRYAGDGIDSYALHPGVVNSGIWDGVKGPARILIGVFRLFMISPEKGAATSIYLATSPRRQLQSGQYYNKSRIAPISATAENKEAAERLWEISENMVITYESKNFA